MKKEVIIYTSIFALAFILTSVALFFLTRDKNAAAADSLSTSILDSIKILQDEKKRMKNTTMMMMNKLISMQTIQKKKSSF